MSLYHDYLRDTAAETDRHEGLFKPSLPVLVFRPLTPCFEDIAVPRWNKHRHVDGDFATYLRHAVRHLNGERHQNDYKHKDSELLRLANRDIVAAAFKICMLETEANGALSFRTRVQESAFVTLAMACADGDMAEVKALNGIVETVAGISALTTPLLLQILVAVAFCHDNNRLVADLVLWSPPPRRNLFNLKPRSESSHGTWLWSHWLFSGPTGKKPLGGWDALLRAGWVAPCADMMEFVYRAQDTPEEVSYAIYVFERVLQSKDGLPKSVLNTIEQTVKMGPPAVVAHMLTILPHQKIRPRPHFLLTDAVRRPQFQFMEGARRISTNRNGGSRPLGAEMLEVLRPMNLNVNSMFDPRGKSKSVSPLEQTPLHAATYWGDLEAIKWCLKGGARPRKDRYGKYQWEKLQNGDKKEILALYKSEGWEIDSEAWLNEHEQRMADMRKRGGLFFGLYRLSRKLSLSS